MSDDEAERAAETEKARNEQREAALVFNRIRELHDNPIQGNFDAEHLKAVHAYIFQDLPHHQPGVIRKDTTDWTKDRGLEGRSDRYDVPYVSHDVDEHITTVLDRFGGTDSLKGVTPEAAAVRLAEVYGDLDYGHGFYEGNSRTLREFTRELAAEAGFTLDWAKTGVEAGQRNELYLARDLAVYEREFSGLTEERAMQTDDRREYEAYFTLERLRAAVGERTLETIIGEGLSAARDIDQQQGVGGEADATRGFQDIGDVIEAGLERVFDAVADLAGGAIETLADGFAELLGGGSPVPSRQPSPVAMTAKERHEARIKAFLDSESADRAARQQEVARRLGASAATMPEELQRDRSGGQSL